MNANIQLTTTWQLWPLVAWDWFYCGWEYCERCRDHGHETRRAITVMIHLPFAVLTVNPGIRFKTRVAIEGCPNKRRAAAPVPF